MYLENKKFMENEKPKKLTQKEEYNNVEIKNKEKIYFENVFRDLCALEKEESSEDSKEKKYQKKGKNTKKKSPKKNNSTLNKKIQKIQKKQFHPLKQRKNLKKILI